MEITVKWYDDELEAAIRDTLEHYGGLIDVTRDEIINVVNELIEEKIFEKIFKFHHQLRDKISRVDENIITNTNIIVPIIDFDAGNEDTFIVVEIEINYIDILGKFFIEYHVYGELNGEPQFKLRSIVGSAIVSTESAIDSPGPDQ